MRTLLLLILVILISIASVEGAENQENQNEFWAGVALGTVAISTDYFVLKEHTDLNLTWRALITITQPLVGYYIFDAVSEDDELVFYLGANLTTIIYISVTALMTTPDDADVSPVTLQTP